MEHIVYLDNSSTTKPCKKACEYINTALTEIWGNPSSLHNLGLDAEIAVSNTRKAVAKLICCNENEIIFTGSGTEANNACIMNVISKKNAKKIITSKIEHPSVLETVKRAEEAGFEVIRLDCDSNGIVSLEQLKNALSRDTALVSIMLVNNEVGTVQPIGEAVKLVKQVSKDILFHCDAVQAFGKIPLNVKTMGVDFLSASAHKIHGPKGIGILYCKKGVHLKPFITGGGQERGLRSGTESVPLIYGFKGAIEELTIKESFEKINKLNDYAREKISNCGFAQINSPEDACAFILNISVPGFRSETLLHFLERKNIFVSSGSACAKGEASYVLKSMGLDRARSDSALRLSFCKDNTKQDVDLFLSALNEATATLRRSNI